MEKAVRDSYGRTIEYMRISITDRCNLRCRYCMPDGAKWIPMSEILTYEEIERICREAVRIGITRFKITGGEPLVRKGCADLIRMIRQIPGTEEVTMTTNGVLLDENLEDLLAAGLDAVNISLDTLIPEKYQEITGADELERVRKSIFMAEKSGIRVKINTVLQKGVNDEEWKSLAELAKKNKLDVRFIELMPIGQGRAENGISGAWVLGKLKEAYGIEGEFYPLEGRFGNGPAAYYQLPGFQGKIGLISALHGKFCDRCNRIRMTSTGKLKACLCYADTISVFEAARHGSEEEIRKLKRAKADPIIAPDKGQVLWEVSVEGPSVAPFIGRKYQHDEVFCYLSTPWGEYEKILTGFTGRVVEICAKQGDTVNKGDVIAYIQRSDIFA